MKVSRESISQLASVGRQVHVLLLHILDHHGPRSVVCSKLTICQKRPLLVTAVDCPHQECWYILRDGLRQGGELGGVASNLTCSAVRVEGKNIQGADDLV